MTPSLPGHLRLVEPLGDGSEKRAFLAEDLRTGERVVAAEVRAREGEALDRLHEIATIQRDARAHCVAPIAEIVEHAGACWLVGEFFPGGDLAAYLGRRTTRALPLSDCLRIGARIARALTHAHAHGFVHGDVKPENLVIDAAGDVFLTDFGLRQRVGDRAGAWGTVEYMAPELQRGDAVEPASDLYSLGCVLHELATGAPPFRADLATEVLRMQLLAEPRPLREVRPDAPRLLERLVARLLAKDPGDRPHTAADVATSLDAIRTALPPLDLSVQPSVGRAAERRRLFALPPRVRDGASECVRIRGAAGLGKSRLLGELRDEAERAGLVALVATADDGTQRPHGVLADWLRPLAAWLDALDPKDAAVLRRLFGDGPADERPVGPGSQGEVTRAFAAAVRRIAEDQPLALLLDDEQWADSDSGAACESLATAIARGAADLAGVLVASTVRAEPGERDESALASQPHFEAIELAPFGESDVYDLLEARGAEQPTAQLVRVVAGASAGNPLFADLIVEQLFASDRIVRNDGVSEIRSPVGDEIALPPSLAAGVDDALAALSADVRRDVELAACLGRRFDTATLAAIEGKAAGLDRRLHEAEAAGLVRAAAGEQQFRHALVWRAVYDGIDVVRREQLHQQIAVWAMRQPDAAMPDRAFFVARHLLRGGSQVGSEELAHWTREAGELAFRRFAWKDAADLYEVALSQLAARGDAEPRLLAELHSRAGAGHYFSYDSRPAIRHLTAAVEGLDGVDDLEYTRALNDLVRVNAQSGIVGYHGFGELAPALESAARKLGDRDEHLRARVYMTLSEAHWTAGNPEDAERYGRRAVDLASRIGDGRLCGEAHVIVAITRLQACDLGQALAGLRTAMAHARRHDDPYVLRFARGRMPLLLLGTGRFDEARDAIRDCIASDEVVVNPGDASMSRALLAYSSVVAGRYDDADREAELALELIRRVEFPWPRLILNPALAYAGTVRRDFAAARELVREYVRPGVVFDDPSPLLPTARRFEALIDYYAGDPLPLRADDLGADLVPEDAVNGRLDLSDLVGVGLHVELCDAAGVAPDPRVDRVLARADEQGVVLTLAWPFSLPRARGFVALAEGRVEDAERHFDRDVEIARRRGAASEIARARYERARALVQRGTRLAYLHAAEELASARPVLSELGPPVLAERCERLFEFAEGRSR